MFVNLSGVWSTLPNFPISEFISSLIGGFISYFAIYRSDKRSSNERQRRIRRALISEIDSLQVKQMHIISQFLETGEDDLGVVMSTVKNVMIPNELEEKVSDELIREKFEVDETKKKSLTEVGRQANEINYATPVYNSNADKVGELEPEQINAVIQFYRILEQVKSSMGKAIEAAENESEQDSDDSEFAYDYYISQLQNLTEELAERKKAVLKELNANEFIEIEDTYKANRTDTEQD
ncbi:hypothetical protein [Halobacterium salinarum]|uniref:hypothetical protein n=1 Tax=Halobacterium salinarum TaxID=2242 RepID=UPI001F161B2C|nr:hypothetical protein [Halobacterium salinarum]MCF2165814.1 hypothetical protein [Halobacterium salinarum]MCF2167417.1 hypothetical protein [Halobacterium salinarum]